MLLRVVRRNYAKEVKWPKGGVGDRSKRRKGRGGNPEVRRQPQGEREVRQKALRKAPRKSKDGCDGVGRYGKEWLFWC